MPPNSSASFGLCHHFECVLLNMIEKLPEWGISCVLIEVLTNLML